MLPANLLDYLFTVDNFFTCFESRHVLIYYNMNTQAILNKD